MTPNSYTTAKVRNVLPACAGGRIGFGLDVPGGATVRYAISLDDARFLSACLLDYINDFAGTQSLGSALIPSEHKSVPSEGENV